MFSLWRCFLVCTTIVSTNRSENVQVSLSLHTVESRRWCDPAQLALSIGTATLNALLGSGPCRNTAMSCWERSFKTKHTAHGSQVTKSQFVHMLLNSFPWWKPRVFRGARWRWELQGELCVCGALGSPAGWAWGAPAAVTRVPARCHVWHCQDGPGPVKMLHQLHLVPSQVRDVRAACTAPRICAPKPLHLQEGPKRSVAWWQCQLLIWTVAVPGSCHFRSHNKALTPLL